MTRAFSAGVLGFLLLVSNGCDAIARRPSADPGRAAAAAHFTKRYASSRFAQWRLKARPAGSDCAVLLIETGVLMDSSMIETVQYGAGSSEVFEGGALRFARENRFRGVAYRDGGDATWSYDIAPEEEKSLTPCR